MFQKYLFPVVLTAALLAGIVTVAHAAPPRGVDHLRGRWDGVILGLYGDDLPFVLMLDEFKTDPNDSTATLYNGCMSVGGAYAPVSARFVSLGGGNYNMTLYGTAAGAVIQFTGFATTNDPTVTDDPASGVWQNASGGGDWSAYHHDRREPNCPAVQLGDEIYFHASVNAVVGVDGENRNEGNTIEGFSNIVSSGLQATLPGGSSVTIPFFTDLFSPNVNFVDNFRYLEGFDSSLPIAGETYTFTLLDVFGDPIPGTTVTDVWYDCTTDAPRNVEAVVAGDGIHVTWDASASAPGFDPLNFIGFYQIELYPDGGGEFGYGSNWIQTPEHLIPFVQFGGSGAGSPNGNDFGYSLSELPDGLYSFDVIAFSEAFGSGSVGLECQIRALDERVRFEKSGDTITLLP
jgi:hypothetical protein